MEQHPVPQDITTYQFRLVGDMTLKQFIELASGIGLAILVFNTPLPIYIKWPLILFFVLAGVAFAFLPLQGRPLDVWVKNFFKSIYTPTQFLWKKSEKLPDFFTYTPLREKILQKTKLSPEERARFAEYLKSLPGQKSFSAYDKEEQAQVTKINEFIQKVTGTKPTKIFPALPQLAPVLPPLPLIRVRKLGKSEPSKGQKFNLPGAAAPVVEIAQPLNPPLEIGTPWTALPMTKPKPRVTKMPELKPKPKPKPKCKITSVTAPALPIPALPELPNVIVGMVLDHVGKILPNAIIEIRDKEQMPVRASKTNKLGQFFMATPLPNGEYELETEYSPYVFDIIKFKTEGKIIPPIKIQAKSQEN